MADFIDHYSVLDMCPSAYGSELYSAYCRAVRQWLKNDPSFDNDNLTRIQDSYRILQNPGKRRTFHAERLLKVSKVGQLKKAESYVNQLTHVSMQEESVPQLYKSIHVGFVFISHLGFDVVQRSLFRIPYLLNN